MSAADRRIFAPSLFGWVGLLWFIAVVFLPAYIFDSGMAQPSHIALFAVCGLYIAVHMAAQKIVISDMAIYLGLFVLLCGFINVTYGIYYRDYQFFYSAAYYVFNAVVFAGTVLLFQSDPTRMHNFMRYAVYTSVILQIAYIGFSGGDFTRETGSFNNPNQLGYWAVLNAAIIMVMRTRQRLTVIDIVVFALCGIIVFLSFSRAAIIVFILLSVILLLSRQLSLRWKIPLVTFTLTTAISFIDFFEPITHRLLSGITDPYAMIERGYQRLITSPHYILFGAGEGAYWRFPDNEGRGIELHSGIATILFSYGVVGLGLFVGFIYAVLKRLSWVPIFIFAAIMLYGVTHQHIRFTGFWIFMAVLYTVGQTAQGKHNER